MGTLDLVLARSTNVLDLVHTDICKMTNTLTRGGERYFITFIDDASKYTYVFFIRTKDKVFEKFKSYKAEVENSLNLKIKTLRFNRGGEYIDSDFIKFCEEHGITREMSVSYTPQQNKVTDTLSIKYLFHHLESMLVIL